MACQSCASATGPASLPPPHDKTVVRLSSTAAAAAAATAAVTATDRSHRPQPRELMVSSHCRY